MKSTMKIHIWSHTIRRTVILLSTALITAPVFAGTVWTGFRGDGTSLTDASDLPIRWSPEQGVAWKKSIPGDGQSSPVVWGDRVFLTSLSGDRKESLYVVCLDLTTGNQQWKREWVSSFPEDDSNYISKAAPTPVVDADRLIALFESGDLIAMDHGGETLWRRRLTEDFGPLLGNHGMGSSPAQTPSSVVVLMDHKGPSYLAAFDKKAGETLWKVDRTQSSAWSSPTLVQRGDRSEIVVSSGGSVDGYDAAGGELLWTYQPVEGNNVPSPTVHDDYIAVGSREKGSNFVLRLDTNDPGRPRAEVAWEAAEVASAFGSPLIHRGRVYYSNKAGVLFCYRLESGSLLFQQRLPASTWASALGCGDRVYFFCTNGQTAVITASDEYELVAQNGVSIEGNDRIYGVAAVDGCFIVRSASTVWRLGPN